MIATLIVSLGLCARDLAGSAASPAVAAAVFVRKRRRFIIGGPPVEQIVPEMREKPGESRTAGPDRC
jgi:hypothetical protein